MSNWNADFSGYPKTTSKGDVFGSDKALKYPMKKAWDNQGKKVLYIKSMKLSSGKDGEINVIPRSLKERYEYIFDVDDLKLCKDSKVVFSNLFSAIDVKNFGATFAEEGNNISITGAVQIGQGFNLYSDSIADEQQILSPFRDPTEKSNKAKNKEEQEEAKNSTLGTKIISDEAHYFYPFVINPLAYKEFKELDVTKGYTEEDYIEFKEAALTSATGFATNSKIGCDNEFALFIETDINIYLPLLTEFVKFEKRDDKNIIELNCGELLESFGDKIKSIQIYYNPHTTNIVTDIKGARKYNIFTKQEV
jgi:CRISPR-associated protein Csh2